MRVPGQQRKSYMWRWTAALAGVAVLGIALVMAVVVSPASRVQGATLRVTSLDDTDNSPCTTACTLRGAINSANDGDTITMSISGGGSIDLTSDLPTIDQDNLTIRGQTNVTVESNNTDNFNGLAVDADGFKLSNLNFDGNGSTGTGLVFASGPDDATISNVRIEDFGAGGIVFGGDNDSNTITGSTINDNGVGISFGDGSHDNEVASTTVKDSGGNGISFGDSCDDNLITGSTIKGSGGNGVSVGAGRRNSVVSSTVEESGDDGVDFSGGHDSTVSSSTITESDGVGMDTFWTRTGPSSRTTPSARTTLLRSTFPGSTPATLTSCRTS